jgi:hypothetical protein
MHKVSAFKITSVNIVTPKQLANAPQQDDYIVLLGDEPDDRVSVDREFVAKNQPNIGDWFVMDTLNQRVVGDDYFTHIYSK